MAILKKFLPEKHDIHTYDPQASYEPRWEGRQSGYNLNCHGSHIEWSGVSLRNRAFCRTISSWQTAGFTEPYVVSDINFWNTCNPCAVLVSPKHAIICQHYRGTHPRVEEWYTFLGKSGTRYSRKVVSVTLDVGPDHTLLTFENPLPTDDLFIYSRIADVSYMPAGYDIWIHDCNGKAYSVSFTAAQLSTNGNVGGFAYAPKLDILNVGIGHGGWHGIFPGDSGSPSFAIDKLGNTVLVGLMHGGSQINAAELLKINSIISNDGYRVDHVKISAKKEDLNADGKVDGTDLSLLLSSWGNGDALKDLDGDGIVSGSDISMVISSWGTYPFQPNIAPAQIQPSNTDSSSDSSNVKPRI